MVLVGAETFEQDRTAEFRETLSTNLNLALPALHFSLMIRRISGDVGPYLVLISFMSSECAQSVTIINFLSIVIVVIPTVFVVGILHPIPVI